MVSPSGGVFSHPAPARRWRITNAQRLYSAVLLVSAATLILEIALTRVFAVAQGYHFAFLSVSLALLGFGVSGTVLALAGRRLGLAQAASPAPGSLTQQRPRETRPLGRPRFLAACPLLFSLFTLGSYLGTNYLPFDSYRIAWEPVQWAYFALYYALLSLPFLFSGLFVGFLLASRPLAVGPLYGSNMAGSALGSLLSVLLLPALGAPGEIALASVFGLVAGALLTNDRRASLALVVCTLVAFALLVAASPGWLDVQLSPYRGLSQALRYPGARVTFAGWSQLGRIDVLESGGIRAFPGLSLGYAGALPPQLGLLTDGDNLTPLTKAAATRPELLQALPQALAYRLLPSPNVLLIEPHGNADALLARSFGARSITVLEGDDLVANLISRRYADYLGGTYSPPGTRLLVADARGYLARGEERFDLVEIALGDSFRPITAGASTLSENYLYTAEAFRAYYDHLAPGGLLLVTRWLQTPPSEDLRCWLLAVGAVERAGGEPARQLVAYRSWSTVSILAARSPFTTEQIALLKTGLSELSFDAVYYPGVRPEETNRYNVLPALDHYDLFARALGPGGEASYSSYGYDVTPPKDDRPFFYHFFRWEQTGAVLAQLGTTWQPFGGGGYLLTLGLLVLVTGLSAVLMLVPLLPRRRGEGKVILGARPLCYFALLGAGYLLVEIPLVQRAVLLLGHPTRAFAATLLALLLFSGLGSLVAARRVHPSLICAAVALAAATYPGLLSLLSTNLLGLEATLRFAAFVLALAPLGFAMGIPFPRGLSALGSRQAALTPWAWAVNGFTSVASSVGAALLALGMGFSAVVWLGAVAYALAALAATGLGGRAASAPR